MNCLYILVSLISAVTCWSSLNKGDKSYITHKLNESPDFKYYKQAARPFKTCKDENELCNVASGKEYKSLCGKDKFASVCKRTCGRCPAVSALSCHASAEGCCWDNITKVSSGCPECIDRSVSCKKAYKLCNLSHIKRACPETCTACPDSKKCYDDEHQKEFCPYWKEGGFCESDRDLMVEYCAKTCGLCDLKNPVKMAATASNTVIEVFRKGSDSLINLSADEKLASEKQLIKILLEEKKKRESNTEKKIANASGNEIVATVLNDNKKKENTVEKAASETKKSTDESKKSIQSNSNVLSDESFEALVKLINLKDKKAETKRQEEDDKAFEVFIKELQADEKKMSVSKKETEDKPQTEQSKRSEDALIELLLKDELEKNSESKKEASPMLTKKSVEDGETKSDQTKEVASKKETKLLDDISAQYLMNLMDKEKKKREAKLSPEEAVHQALFDLLKERIEAQEDKKKEM